MLVKLWSQDHRIKKLVSVSDFEDLKKKSVEEGMCSPGSNLKASSKRLCPVWTITLLKLCFKCYRYFLRMEQRCQRLASSACCKALLGNSTMCSWWHLQTRTSQMRVCFSLQSAFFKLVCLTNMILHNFWKCSTGVRCYTYSLSFDMSYIINLVANRCHM